MYQIGFDIGGTNVAAGLVNDSLDITAKISIPFPKDCTCEGLALALKNMADELMRGAVDANEVDCIGLAVPGSIDPTREYVVNSHNLGLHNAPLRACVQAHFPSIPVFMANDADAAAVAELYKGAFVGAKTAMLITLGTGIGGGIILGGRLFSGGRGSGVEFGHAVLQHGGIKCACGNRGCVETLCAAPRLTREGRRAFCENKGGMLYSLAGGDIDKVTAQMVIDAAKAGDGAALAIFEDYVDALGSAVATIINTLDPEVIALGGGVSHAGDFLFNALRENVCEKSFFDEFAQIVPARMGNDAGIIGAAMLKRDAEV